MSEPAVEAAETTNPGPFLLEAAELADALQEPPASDKSLPPLAQIVPAPDAQVEDRGSYYWDAVTMAPLNATSAVSSTSL
jgi:hypothetical protein